MITVSGDDEAGNAFSYTEEETSLMLDFTAPTAQCTANPAVAALGDLLVVTVTTSEPVMGDMPDFQSTPQMTTAAQPEEGATSFTYTLEVAEMHQGLDAWSYLVNIVDPAGNITLGACSGGGTLDAEPPALSDLEISVSPEVTNAQGLSLMMVGDEDQLNVEFSVTEANGITIDEVALAISGLPFALDQTNYIDYGGGNHHFTYSRTMDLFTLLPSEGSWPVRLVMSDDAGNQTSVPALGDQSVTLDFTPPTADCSLVPSAPSAGYGIGQTVTLYVSPLEELSLGSTPDVFETLSPSPGGTFLEYEENSSYRYSGTVGEWDAQGSISARVELTDLVGNATTPGGNACINSAGASYDAIRPTVAGGADGIIISHERVKEDEQFYLAFSLTDGELLDQAPTVSVGNAAMEENDGLANEDYAFAYTPDQDIDPADEEGIWPLSVTLEDGAGNQTVYSPGTVQFDFGGPQLSGSTSLQYGVPDGCPLSSVTSLTHGSTLQVFFAVNEILDEAPQVWAEGDGINGTLDLSPVGVADRAIIFTRIPWGNDATDGDKAYFLRGDESAVEGEARIRVYDAATIDGASFLGQTTAAGDGSFGAEPGENGAFELVPSPLAQVFVEGLDSACNRSSGSVGEAAGVRNSEWVATMGYKVAGSTAANPHELLVRPRFANSLRPPASGLSGPPKLERSQQ